MYCHKLKKEAMPLARKPLPGVIGDRLLQEISQEAWDLWLQQQTMLINEYQLSSYEPETQQFLREKMETFLFSDDEVKPQQYQPKEK